MTMQVDKNAIRQYAADNAPNAIMKTVKVVASYVLVVPANVFENVIKVLVAKNVPYQTYPRSNDFVIAILMKGNGA